MITLLALVSTAFALPPQLPHQGRLLDVSGTPMAGTEDVTFAIYDTATGGAALWSETLSVDFDDGFYSVNLGLDVGNPLTDADLDAANLFLGVTVGTGTESDRLRLGSVPYARMAGGISGGIVDASEIHVDGTMVIDSSGTFVGTPGGQSLYGLNCAADDIPLFDGTDWGCTAAASATVAWDDVTGRPFDLVDGDDDTLGALVCGDTQVAAWSLSNQAWLCHTTGWAELAGVPADLADGSIAWGEVTGIPADIGDGDADEWAEIANIPADIADGDADDWSEIANIPADIADGDADDWSEIANIPADLADGSIDWAELTGLPGDLSDGVIDWAELTSIPPDLSDGVIDWAELTGIPADIADGDDQLTEADVDGFLASGDVIMATGASDVVGIGGASSGAKLDVQGNLEAQAEASEHIVFRSNGNVNSDDFAGWASIVGIDNDFGAHSFVIDHDPTTHWMAGMMTGNYGLFMNQKAGGGNGTPALQIQQDGSDRLRMNFDGTTTFSGNVSANRYTGLLDGTAVGSNHSVVRSTGNINSDGLQGWAQLFGIDNDFAAHSFIIDHDPTTHWMTGMYTGNYGMYMNQKAGGSGGTPAFRIERNGSTVFNIDFFGNMSAAGSKSFVQPHPTEPDTDIYYVALEGGEAGTYARGTTQLSDGEARVSVPEHFGLVTGGESLTVHLTANGRCGGPLYVAERSPSEVVVRVDGDNPVDCSFDWLVMGVRDGFEDFEVIRPRQVASGM